MTAHTHPGIPPSAYFNIRNPNFKISPYIISRRFFLKKEKYARFASMFPFCQESNALIIQFKDQFVFGKGKQCAEWGEC